MDEARFDRWTRILAVEAPRRQLLAGLVAGTFAGVVGGQATEAGKRNKKRNRRGGKVTSAAVAKTWICHRTNSDTNQYEYIEVSMNAIDAHRNHEGDTFGVNLMTDPNHCGECGNACDSGATCEGGTCTVVNAQCIATTSCQEPRYCPGIECSAVTATSGDCVCVHGLDSPRSTPCTTDTDCHVSMADRCNQFEGRCAGARTVTCTTDAECAFLGTCQEGICGGQGCTTDEHCRQLYPEHVSFGRAAYCVSAEALPCHTQYGINTCGFSCRLA